MQWLRLHGSNAGAQVQSQDREVGSHMPGGVAKKKKEAFSGSGRREAGGKKPSGKILLGCVFWEGRQWLLTSVGVEDYGLGTPMNSAWA